jgi:glycerophosphoryl diester phosphodiesterase
MTTWQKIITLYRTNRRGIIYYILLKVIFFGLLILAVHWLKSKLLTDNQFVYDLNILKYFSPDDIFALLVVGIFWLLFFILERNFLIFYFVNKHKRGKISYRIFWREFLLTQLTQLKIFLLEVAVSLLNVILFSIAIYVVYYFVGINFIFYIISSLLTIGFMYVLVGKLLKFIFMMYYFFDNPREKNIFIYFAKDFSSAKKRRFLIVLVRAILAFILILGISLGITWLGQYLVGLLNSFLTRVYLLGIILFGQAILFFAVNVMMYVYIFFKLAEAFFDKTFSQLELEYKGVIKFPKKYFKNRTIFRVVSVILISVFLVGLYLYFIQITLIVLADEKKPKLIFAHRGFSEYNVQNSLPAFRESVGRADFIELDIQITRDGKLIVFHDENFKKLTGQVGVATQRDFGEIKKYILKENKQLPGEGKVVKTGKIILLDDVFGELAGKINFAVEIKNTDRSREQDVSNKLNNLIKKYDIINNVIVTSLDYGALQSLKKINPSIKRGLILTYPISDLGQFDVDLYFVNSLINSEGLIKQAHKLGKPIYFWSFSFWQNDFEKEYVLGADGFITDNPLKTKKEINWYRRMPLAEKVNIIFKNMLR